MASDRPRWTNEIRLFISDTVIDEKYGYPMDGSDDELSERLEDAVNAILCAVYGHEIEFDHCMMPEHRFCIACGRLESALEMES